MRGEQDSWSVPISYDYHQHMISILHCHLYSHLETEPSSLFHSHHHQTPTATHQLWHSSPLNTCSISLRSGTWNALLWSLEIVFGFFRVKVLLLEMTKKYPQTSDFLFFPNYWFLSIHPIKHLRPLPQRPWERREEIPDFGVKGMCSCPTLLHSVILGRSWPHRSTV